MDASTWEAIGTCAAVLVALGALAVAGGANRRATNANHEAKRANAAADKSNEIAAEALEIARAGEQRQQRTEAAMLDRNDVEWDVTGDDDTRSIACRNRGTDIALDVQLVVESAQDPQAWTRKTETATEVPPEGRVLVDLTAEYLEQWRRWEHAASSGIFGTASVPCRGRVTWRTPSGAPRVQPFEDVRL